MSKKGKSGWTIEDFGIDPKNTSIPIDDLNVRLEWLESISTFSKLANSIASTIRKPSKGDGLLYNWENGQNLIIDETRVLVNSICHESLKALENNNEWNFVRVCGMLYHLWAKNRGLIIDRAGSVKIWPRHFNIQEIKIDSD